MSIFLTLRCILDIYKPFFAHFPFSNHFLPIFKELFQPFTRNSHRTNGKRGLSKRNFYSTRSRNLFLQDIQKQFTNERYCGHRFGNRLAGPVVSTSRPFLFRVKTDATEPFSGTAITNRGFNLEYKQIPCSLSPMDAISFA